MRITLQVDRKPQSASVAYYEQNRDDELVSFDAIEKAGDAIFSDGELLDELMDLRPDLPGTGTQAEAHLAAILKWVRDKQEEYADAVEKLADEARGDAEGDDETETIRREYERSLGV